MKWKDSGQTFEQPPAGTHLAICIRVIDIGTHTSEYQGQPITKRQCIIGWELPGELMTKGEHAGKPFMVSKFYTSSLSEKANLRKDLVNWRGREFTEAELKGFDPKNILGKPCMLSLTINEKGKVRISGVMSLMKGTPVPKQINENIYFSLDEFDLEIFDDLSDGYKKMIMESPEYQKVIGQPEDHPVDDAFDDDIAF